MRKTTFSCSGEKEREREREREREIQISSRLHGKEDFTTMLKNFESSSLQ
jgi:hypothetical protein